MENYDLEIKRIKRNNYIVFGIFAAVILAVIVAGIVYQYQHSFSTAKWERNPEERTKIVDDLLEDYEIVGMQKADVVELLGCNNNDYGYLNEENRFVYYLGPERGLISIDSEWLILDFANDIVVDCYITTD